MDSVESTSNPAPAPAPESSSSNPNSQIQPGPPPKVKRIFECSGCGLNEEYDYFGTKPPFCKAIVFHEESYVMRDPFTLRDGNNSNFLLLGSNCGICLGMTCQDCSLFFTRRICSSCAQSHSHLLPEELRLIKKKQRKD